ncbi:hypothetical protein [Micromonospora endophytica]|nr:hypothetical protein [Micromonospora endophytica]
MTSRSSGTEEAHRWWGEAAERLAELPDSRAAGLRHRIESDLRGSTD